jgi:hypothetical protein
VPSASSTRHLVLEGVVGRGYAAAPPSREDGAAPGEVARQPEGTAPERTLARVPWGQVWGQVAGLHDPMEAVTRLIERTWPVGRGGFEPPSNGL